MPGVGTHVRWQFLPSLGLLVVLVCGWFGAHAIKAEWDFRQFTKAADRAARLTAPARAALATMHAPVGLSACNSAQQVRGSGLICWSGRLEREPATAALLSELRRAGATSVRPACVKNARLGVVCVVHADLAGSAFDAYIGPDLAGGGGPGSGSYVAAGVAQVAPLGLPRGHPVPAPSAR